MQRYPAPLDRPAVRGHHDGVERPAGDERLYTRQFFQVFVAVILYMTSVALLFHFGQYIEFRGHGVDTLGYLLAVATFGSLAIRLHIGRWIDRLGCRTTWVVGALLSALFAFLMQFSESLWMITLLRTLWTIAAAATMTTFAVLAAQLAPPLRRAESIGTMGMAGFLGMLIGPTLGDWVFAGDTSAIMPYRVFFSISAACSVAAALVVLFLRSADRRTDDVDADVTPDQRREGMLRVIVRHWPGMILGVGFVFGMLFCLHQAFLERLAEHGGFKDIKVFFLVYSPTAITLRIVFRRLPERFGRRRTLELGAVLVALGLLPLLGIRSQWQLIPAALLMGAGHCFVFPSLVDLGASRLPAGHRGLATSLLFGAHDTGMVVGFAAGGEVIDRFGFDRALTGLAATILVTITIYAWRNRREAPRPT